MLYDCPSTSEETLKIVGKLISWIIMSWYYNHNKTNNKNTHDLWVKKN